MKTCLTKEKRQEVVNSGLRKDMPESNERRYYPKVMRRDQQGKHSKAAKW